MGAQVHDGGAELRNCVAHRHMVGRAGVQPKGSVLPDRWPSKNERAASWGPERHCCSVSFNMPMRGAFETNDRAIWLCENGYSRLVAGANSAIIWRGALAVASVDTMVTV